MATTWPNIADTLYSTIEGITPTISPTKPFRKLSTDETLSSIPDVHDDRRFFIEGGTVEQSLSSYTTDSISLNKDFDVIMLYDTSFAVRTLERRIGSDEEQIITTLLKESSRTTGQNWIQFRNTSYDRTSPNHIIVRLTFVTNYDVAYSY